MELYGVNINTIVHDNVAIRCDGCLGIIPGTPWRLNILDIVSAETPVSWTDRPAINPGPFQFHSDPAHVRRWMARKGYLFCRRSEVRDIMRPVPIPGICLAWVCAMDSTATPTSSFPPDGGPVGCVPVDTAVGASYGERARGWA